MLRFTGINFIERNALCKILNNTMITAKCHVCLTRGSVSLKKDGKEIKENVSEFLELPKDIVMDLPRITLIGNLQLFVENHKGIVEYSDSRIRINTKSGTLKVTGKNFFIKTIVTEEVIIYGDIESVEFTE